MDVEWIDATQSEEKILADALAAPHPRMLVCDDQIDRIRGVVNVKDILAYYIRHRLLNLDDILFQPLYIPEQAAALKILEMFRETKRHFGVVISEYGSVEGIVTLHDLTENIMGDLPAPGEEDETEVFRREDGSYLVDGSMKVEDAEDLLNVSSLFDADEERPDVNTLAAWPCTA